MAIVKLKEVQFRANADLAEHVQAWLEEQDSAVSVRRVFYAMVTEKQIENTHAEYRRISGVCTDLRRGGYVDWDSIVDDTRGHLKTPNYNSIDECMKRALREFRLFRWKGKYHVEVWAEKRGLSVLFPTADELDVLLQPMGGFAIIPESIAGRLLRAQNDIGRAPVILYVGDYDPSGWPKGMPADFQRQVRSWGIKARWERVALNLDQVNTFKLPRAYTILDNASPAFLRKHPEIEILGENDKGPLVNKLEKDPRAAEFKRFHEDLFQVEVDALPIATLRGMVAKAISKYMDKDSYDSRLVVEQMQRATVAEKLNIDLEGGA